MLPPVVAIGLTLPGALAATAGLLAVLRTLRAVPSLATDRSPEPAAWPKVSLIVPACNEAERLETAVRTRLADDYPALEVILVEDRSIDDTPRIVDRLAAEDPRVRAVHVRELPEGWLGKVHALHVGAQHATGAWLLFSDADVRFAPGTLRRAVARCEARGIDHMATIPDFIPQGLVVDACIDSFCRALVVGGRLWSVPDPRSRVAVGGGLFNLVRRSAFDRTEGFAWLRLEIADDVVLGQMLKRNGARPEVTLARDLVSLEFYDSVSEMAWGLEKSGFAILCNFSFALAPFALCAYLLLELGWAVGLASGVPAAQALGAYALATAVLATVILQRWSGRSLRTVPLMHVASLLFAWMVARSAWLVWRRGGVAWRGTLYPTDALRAGRRLVLF